MYPRKVCDSVAGRDETGGVRLSATRILNF
jgi:hypothetical protein